MAVPVVTIRRYLPLWALRGAYCATAHSGLPSLLAAVATAALVSAILLEREIVTVNDHPATPVAYNAQEGHEQYRRGGATISQKREGIPSPTFPAIIHKPARAIPSSLLISSFLWLLMRASRSTHHPQNALPCCPHYRNRFGKQLRPVTKLSP